MSERDLHERAAKGMAGQLEETPTVIRLRTRVNEQMLEIDGLRTLCAILYSGPHLYTDDGELQDNREPPFIDFRSDSPEAIREKIMARAQAKLQNADQDKELDG